MVYAVENSLIQIKSLQKHVRKAIVKYYIVEQIVQNNVVGIGIKLFINHSILVQSLSKSNQLKILVVRHILKLEDRSQKKR